MENAMDACTSKGVYSYNILIQVWWTLKIKYTISWMWRYKTCSHCVLQRCR